MKLKIKFILVFSVLIILLEGGLIYYTDNYLRSYVRNEATKDFQNSAQLNKTIFLTFLDTMKIRTFDWSSDTHIRESLMNYFKTGSKKSIEDLNHMLKSKIIYDESIIIADILDKNGVVISSSIPERIGVNEKKEEEEKNAIRFSEAIKSEFGDIFVRSMILEEDETEEPMSHITVRFFTLTDDDQIKPTPLDAVLLLHFVKGKELADLLSGRIVKVDDKVSPNQMVLLDQYKTAEVYMVNSAEMMVTPSRFIKDSVFKQKVGSVPVKECFERGNNFAGEYVNYLDKQVFGVSSCFKDENLVFIVEGQFEELLLPLRDIRERFLFIGFAIFVLSISSIWFLSDFLLKNLNKIILATQEMLKNNFTVRVKVNSNDETGYLAEVLNLMADNVVKFKTELEKTANEQQAGLLESINDGLVGISRDFKIVLWNKAASKITGWSREEVVGKPFRDVIKLLRERDRSENITFIEEALLFGKPREMANNTILVQKDGYEIPVANSAAPIFDQNGEVFRVIVVLRDVGHERDAQMLKSDFAYASHQLRTPVTEALLSLEMALDTQEKDIPIMKENIKIAYRAVKNTQKLVEQLLVVSQIDQHRIIPKMENIDLRKLFKDILVSVQKEVKKNNIKLSLSPTRGVFGVVADPELLRITLSEVLQNAIFYSPENSEIKVVLASQDEGVLIEVRDSGSGIPENQQASVFTKFFRGSNVPENVIGVGLGLFIAQEYMRLINGKIWFSSKEGQGTTFYILLKKNEIRD